MVTLHPCAICTSGLHCNVHLWTVLILSYDLHYLVQHRVAIAHREGHHPSTKNSSARFSNGGRALSTALEWFLPLLSTAQLPLDPFSLQNSQPVAPLPITHLSHTQMLWQSWGRRWWWCWGSQGFYNDEQSSPNLPQRKGILDEKEIFEWQHVDLFGKIIWDAI